MRAIALCITAMKGNGAEQEFIECLVRRYGAQDSFSPKEKAFIWNTKPSEYHRIQFSWRHECFWVLLWCLGYIDRLGQPTCICDVPTAVRFLLDRDTKQFIEEATLRPEPEIVLQGELAGLYHWILVDARLKGNQAPAALNVGVVKERHYTLNWLVIDVEPWDEVNTDT